ncbi:MAG: hypothetical protein AB1489_42240, partial [Acidobacteriota bacterium]
MKRLRARLVLAAGLLVIILISVVLIARQSRSLFQRGLEGWESQRQDLTIWFDDIEGKTTITADDGDKITGFVVAQLRSQKGVELPSNWQQDTMPRIVLLSISDSRMPARVVLGTGRGIVSALNQAITQARSLLESPLSTVWIKLDIVEEVFTLERLDPNQPLELERSLYGLAFQRQSGIVFLPEELVANTLVGVQHFLQTDNVIQYLQREPTRAQAYQHLFQAQPIRAFRFSTASFCYDGSEIFPLYRGHRYWKQLEHKQLYKAAVEGGKYLSQVVDTDGKFVYIYSPKTNAAPPKYNLLRHAGSVYAMFELYQVTGDKELLAAAERALGYLLNSIKTSTTNAGPSACLVGDGNYVKLGGNALAVIALAKYIETTGDRKYLPLLQQLGRWIKSVQSSNGQFAVHKQSYTDGRVIDFESQYYPGEAILALVRINALDRNKAWLDAAEAGAQYLINVRDENLSEKKLPHDHWLLYALNELYRQRPKPLYLEQAMRLARAMLRAQRRNPKYPDWRGGFFKPPRSTPTATRMEGLCAAYKLAKDFGRQADAEAILAGLRLGAIFQLQTQFRPESAMYLQNPLRA